MLLIFWRKNIKGSYQFKAYLEAYKEVLILPSMSEEYRVSGPGVGAGEFPRRVDSESTPVSPYFRFKALT